VLLGVIALAVAGCASPTDDSSALTQASDSPASTEKVESSDAGASSSNSGSYLTLADYEATQDAFASTKVVLFFSAVWCSTCKRARDNIEADLTAIPADLTIVVADFDTAIDLRRTYGVGVQHTFVYIDNQGNEIKKWSGSVTTDDIYERVQ
jgi:thiol-disulfide isomerase/thioredoxin